MTTVRQKKVAQKIVENATLDKPVSSGQVLKSVGYGTGLQNQPKRVLESDGVKEELAILGFDEDSAKSVVKDILQTGKEENRLKASDMIFKVQGSYAPERRVNLNAKVDMTENKEAQELAEEYEEKLRAKLLDTET